MGSVQLNLLIRVGSLSTAIASMLAVHLTSLPGGPAILAGLGIGVLTGTGSIMSCLSLIDMPISMVVTLSNLYLVITAALGIALLHESDTVLKLAGLAATLAGVLLLAYSPASRYGVHSASSIAKRTPPPRAYLSMGGYVLIIGIGARADASKFLAGLGGGRHRPRRP
jgi:drug/metabolite transporter (DMT)-like permease